MKFKGIMTENCALKEFQAIISSMSRFAKDCVIRLTESNIYFIISDDSGPRRPLTWCQLPASFYFQEYSFVGVSPEKNEIYLECSLTLITKALATIKNNVKWLKLKLTHKQVPCFTIELEQCNNDGANKRQYTHDIPVEVIKVEHWSDYEEPTFNDFHVTIQMPILKTMKSIVDSMKNMSESLIVSADKHGKLTLSIKTNMVEVKAPFSDMSVESFAVGDASVQEDDSTLKEDTVSATVDIKKFLQFLTGMLFIQSKTTCSIIQNKMVKILFEQTGSYSMQCFLTQLNI